MTTITKLIASVAVVSAIASPALAQTRNRHLDDYASAHVVVHSRHHQAQQAQHSPNPSYDVYDTSGHYVGSDPDPTIRATLRFDEGVHTLD